MWPIKILKILISFQVELDTDETAESDRYSCEHQV